jgi:hypothetical protein
MARSATLFHRTSPCLKRKKWQNTPIKHKILTLKPCTAGLFLWGFWAADGLSGLVRSCRKAGPAGLRWLLKSPPHLAGQASASLRASLVNPCRRPTQDPGPRIEAFGLNFTW